REQLFTAPAIAAFGLGALDGASGFALVGAAAGDALGTAVGHVADLNEDGASDLIVGAPGADANGVDSGQAYVIFGEDITTIDDGFAALIQTTDLDGTVGFRLDGATAEVQAGTAVGTAGDMNDDGVDDLLIGTSGTAHVVFGDAALGSVAPVDLSTLDGVTGFTATSTAADDQLGRAVGFVGDVDGDGVDDVAVGAMGAAYVLLGRQVGGATSTVQYGLPTTDFIIDGADAHANITLGATEMPALLGATTNTDHINFNGVNLGGEGKDLTVAAGVTISTRQIGSSIDYANAVSMGDSGNISLTSSSGFGFTAGGTVTIQKGASLYAQVQPGSEFNAGNVTITAENITPTIPLNNTLVNLLTEGKHTATVTIEDEVAILGGTIDIESTAGILPITNQMSAAAGGILSSSLGLLAPVAGLLDLPVSVQVSLVEATVSIGKDGGDASSAVTIQGSGTVSIGATATAQAKGDAVMWYNPFSKTNQYGFAVGVWVADATSTITLHDHVTVESTGGNVDISTNSTTTAGGAARVTQNVDQGSDAKNAKPANPNNAALAIGVSSTSTTATVTVKEQASVLAEVGNVSITSEGIDTVKIYPETRSYKDGQFGLTLALEFATADIRTLIQGTVQAGGTEVGKEIIFDPFTTLDTTANTIDVGADHGYQTGEAVVYSPALGGPIDGLERLTTYYVIVVDGSDTLIQLAASEADATNGVAIDLVDNPTLTGAGRSLAFSQVGEVNDWIDYGFAHGFTAGEAVVYTAAEGKRVGGLTDGETYYVVLVEADPNGSLLQLATDAVGENIVDLDPSPILTTENLDPQARELTVASIEEGSNVITLTETHGLNGGAGIFWHPGLGFQVIDPFTEARYAEDTLFYAIPVPLADDPDGMQIRLALTQKDALDSNGYTHAVSLQNDGTVMLGTDHTLAPKVGAGITAKATMTGTHRLETKARIGGSETLLKKFSRPEFASSYSSWVPNIYSNLKNSFLNDAANNNGPLGDNADSSDKSFEFAASIGVLEVDRTVETVIGSTAVLTSGLDIDVQATATETGNVIIEAGSSEQENEKVKIAVGASIAVATYESTVRAIVNDGAQMDASRTIMVEAENMRRFPAVVESAAGFFEELLKDLEKDPAGTLGELNKTLLYPLFTTSWA
ncbi:MAG: hypothetical protein GY939_20355, partial [Actinomycetia bacterium]|nr:hypothetical protein [Actinomycetes bacterium]